MSTRPPASRSRSGADGGKPGRGPKVRTDGKVDASCPQCGTKYRLAAEALDQKIECGECHRVFFPKTTAGKRVQAPDHTKTYMIFGGVGLGIVVLFAVMSGGSPPPKAPPKPPEVRRVVHTPSDNPRSHQLVKWAQAVGSDNRLVLDTHSDLTAVAKQVGLENASNRDAVFAALQSHEATKYLRELVCDSAMLADESMIEAPAGGKAVLFVTPKPGTDDYRRNTRGELDVSFRMDGEQVKVTGWSVKMVPARNPNKPDPSVKTFQPNKDIAAAKTVEITDSAGTRKVIESEPGPVPHWDKASPELRTKADQVVADVIRSADDSAPGNLFNRATGSMRTLDERNAVVPRALNALYELYGDVNGNVMKISQLDRALREWTGGSHNYELEGTGDAEKDKKVRQSCIRQWFAFWWRYSSGDRSDFIEKGESLEMPPPKSKPK